MIINISTRETFIRAIYSYRFIFMLAQAAKGEEDSITLIAEAMQIDREEVKTLVDRYKNLIEYQEWDAKNVWTKVSTFKRHSKPTMGASHDMPTHILQAYQESMAELYRHDRIYATYTCPFRDFIGGKRVVEIGCGAGHLYQDLAAFKPLSYIGVDKIGVMTETLAKSISMGMSFIHGDGILKIQDIPNHTPIETLILSEVLHGVKSKTSFMLDVANAMKPGSCILVMEPRPESARALSLEAQMRVHCGSKYLFDYSELVVPLFNENKLAFLEHYERVTSSHDLFAYEVK